MPEEFELIDVGFDEEELEVLDDWDFDCDIDDESRWERHTRWAEEAEED